MLARRGYSAQNIVEALIFKSRGWGIAQSPRHLVFPLPRYGGGTGAWGAWLQKARAVFAQTATQVWTDLPASPPSGSPWVLMVDALGEAGEALTSRFAGPGVVTLKRWEAVASLSAGRL